MNTVALKAIAVKCEEIGIQPELEEVAPDELGALMVVSGNPNLSQAWSFRGLINLSLTVHTLDKSIDVVFLPTVHSTITVKPKFSSHSLNLLSA